MIFFNIKTAQELRARKIRKCEKLKYWRQHVYPLTNEVCEYQYVRTMPGPPAAMTSSASWSESFTTSDT